MIGGMKVKTSVTLSPGVLAAIDELAGDMSRSEFIEESARRWIRQIRREERDRRDAEIFARLTPEDIADTDDVLAFAVDPFELGDDVEVLIDQVRERAAG